MFNMLNNWINKEYLTEDKIKSLNNLFIKNSPFPNLEMTRFLEKKKLIQLIKSIAKQPFHPKKSDLFQFSQTSDLLKVNDKVIQEFVSLLKSKEMVSFMHELTGLKLNGKIDLFCSIYQDTDYLLVHDDQLKGRKIAFMFYLSDLNEKDGGALALYDNKNKVPYMITKRVLPRLNSFVFFEVSPISFHSVEEVVSNKQRIALTGWFHG